MTDRYDILTSRESNGKTYWTKIGTMWPLDNGGFSLNFDALPIPTLYQDKLQVKAVAFEPKERDQSGSGKSGGDAYGKVKPRRDDLDDEIPF